ncbi:unnamed protein product [Rhizophagus irregularis]|nr:unnamed protein product [Rhizophagus irregularis]
MSGYCFKNLNQRICIQLQVIQSIQIIYIPLFQMAFPDDTHSKCFINNKGEFSSTLGLKSHLLYRGLSYGDMIQNS